MARLILSIWLHWMRCVLFSEQHLQKYFGGCDAESCMTCGKWQYTQDFLIRTLAKRKWHCCVVVYCLPGEDGREHLEVFHKCTLFLSCQIAGQVFPMIITYWGYFSCLLTYFFQGVTAGVWTIGPLGVYQDCRTASLSVKKPKCWQKSTTNSVASENIPIHLCL